MGSLQVKLKINEGTAPFHVKIEAVDPCVDVTFTNPVTGATTTNEVEFDSDNRNVLVTLEFDQSSCTLDSILATLRATVTDSGDPECIDIIEEEESNPCYEFGANIAPLNVDGNYVQFLLGNNTNGVPPFDYSWEVVSGQAFIIGSATRATLQLDRANGDAARVQVTITDKNGCEATDVVTLPAVNTAPVLEDSTVIQLCGDEEEDVVFDIIALGSDADGTIDPATIEITEAPAEGSTAIDTVNGLVTYTPASPPTLDEITINFRVKDNNGNWSNIAVGTVQFVPCLPEPVATQDTASTDCNTPVTIDILSNDTIAEGSIDDNTVVIVHQPLNGTISELSAGVYKYTPNNNFEGVDVFRYTVQSTDGLTSNITATLGSVVITVNPCCDNHNAALSFVCTDNGATIDFDATNVGTPNDVNTDVIDWQVILDEVAGGFSVGSTATVNRACSQDTDTYVNTDDNYTLPGGTFVDDVGTGSTMTVLPLGSNSWEIDVEFENPIPLGMANEIRAFILGDGYEVVDLFVSGGAGLPQEFKIAGITNLQVSTDGMNFIYTDITDPSYCTASVEAYVATSQAILDGITAETELAGFQLSLVAKYRWGATVEVQMRRTITRTNGCPDTVLLYSYTFYMNSTTVCGDMAFTLESSTAPGDGTTPYSTLNFELVLEDATLTELTAVTVGVSNILSQTYDLPDDVQALEDAVNLWLLSNGGGTCEVYWDSPDTLIITVANTTQTFASITTNTGTDLFTAL